MLGEVEPLKALHDESTRDDVVKRILAEFPERVITTEQKVVRLRKNPARPTDPEEDRRPSARQAWWRASRHRGLPGSVRVAGRGGLCPRVQGNG